MTSYLLVSSPKYTYITHYIIEEHTQGTGGMRMCCMSEQKVRKKSKIMFFCFFVFPSTVYKILLWHSCLLLGQRFHWDDYGFRTPFCPPLNADQLCFTSTFYSGYILQPLMVWADFSSERVLTWKEELLPLNTHSHIKISRANKQKHKTKIHPAD